MVFCFCFEWRDGRGKAVLRLILRNLECSTLGETALCTAVTCRLCLCSDLGFSGSKGSKQDCHPQEAPTNLAAASLPQPSCHITTFKAEAAPGTLGNGGVGWAKKGRGDTYAGSTRPADSCLQFWLAVVAKAGDCCRFETHLVHTANHVLKKSCKLPVKSFSLTVFLISCPARLVPGYLE